MAYKLTMTLTKPANVAFKKFITPELATYVTQTFPQDPFLNTRAVAKSTDTEWIGGYTFVSEQSYNAILADSVVADAKTQFDLYNQANGITEVTSGIIE